jgi:hypothetical protein
VSLITEGRSSKKIFFFLISHFVCNLYQYIQQMSCTKARRRVLTRTLLYLTGSESSSDLGSETYELNLKNYIYNYILNLVRRSNGKFFGNRLVSGGS